MTHFAVIAPPFAGHLNPMQAVAGVLAARGHRTSFLHMPDAASMIGSAFTFAPVGEDSHPPGELARTVARINSMRGPCGMRGMIRDLAATTDMLCREVPDRLLAIGASAILADQTEAAGGLIARHLGLPYVSVANALPINTEPGIPPPFTGWAYDPSPGGLRRNKGGYRVSGWLMGRMQNVISHYAAAWSLGPLGTLEDCLSQRAQIGQMTRGLDFPRAGLPACFHYTGPLRAPFAGGIDLPIERPLAFVTLGTLQGNRAGLFRAIAAACDGLGLRCVIAHGGRLVAAKVAALPGAPVVFDFAPQRAVLRQAVVTITHGGLNTVLDSLAEGVPIVALPLAFEQAAIGARITHAGVGRMLKPRPWVPGFVATLAATVSEVLSNPSYRARAGMLRQEIAASGGAERAADLIEAAVHAPIC